MRFDVITLFPEIFAAVAEHGISSRALKRGIWELHCWNPRSFAGDLHRTVDDRPFGGGPGMVMMAEPLAQAVEAVRASGNNGPVIAFSPLGSALTDSVVRKFSGDPEGSAVLVCGRYEGIDERFLEEFVDETFSMGDFVLSGGELPACTLIDAVVRQLPGAIREMSAADESFSTGLLDAPHYTRPVKWRGREVPEVLLTGHHANISAWTREKSLRRTFQKRPDLITMARSGGLLSPEDEAFLRSLQKGS